MDERDGRPNGSRSLWGAEGSIAGMSANVPEAVIKWKNKIENKNIEL